MTKLLLLVLFSFSLFASNIEIYATSLINTFNQIKATSNVVVIYNGRFFFADKAIYNKIDKVLYLYGNVFINSKNDFIITNYVEVDLNDKSKIIKPFFIFNDYDKSWVVSNKVKEKNNIFTLNNNIVSSCNINNPDWIIKSNKSIYDKKDKKIILYNPTFYLKNVPIMYLPYISFSLDRTRRSGFLRPLFGFSTDEGVLYTQPFYWASSINSDVEFLPTIRTKRGKGLYINFRFVDSADSNGNIKVGYFKQYDSYTQKYNLANNEFYGYEINYKDEHLFPINTENKLLLNIKNTNDIAYFYLDAKNYKFNNTITNPLIDSKLRFYNLRNKDFLGFYIDYFKDTTKIDNSDTMKILPEIEYHYFENKLWFDKLLYSANINTKNYYSQKGDKLTLYQLDFPIIYNILLFNNYLGFKYTENMFFTYDKYYTQDIDYRYFSLNSNINFYMNIFKRYKNFNHFINMNINIFNSNFNQSSGIINDYIDTSSIIDSVDYNIKQYFFSKDIEAKLFLDYLKYLKQTTLIEDKMLSSYFNISFYGYNIDNTNKYSFLLNDIYYNNFQIGMNKYDYQISLNNLYKKNESDSYIFNISKKIGYYKYSFLYNYDNYYKFTKFLQFGINMQKRCWNYNVAISRETIPINTADGVSSIKQTQISFKIQFNPIGGIEQNLLVGN